MVRLNMNFSKFDILDIEEITLYKTICPNCGWKNSADKSNLAYFCPKCGKDLECLCLQRIDEVARERRIVSEIN